MKIHTSDVLNALKKENIHFKLRANNETLIPGPVSLDFFDGTGMTFYDGNDPAKIARWTQTDSGLIICSLDLIDKLDSGPFLFVKDVRAAFVISSYLFVPESDCIIHQSAVISPAASIGNDVNIGANSVIGSAEIKDRTKIGALVSISDHVIIGNSVTIMDGALIGDSGLGSIVDSKGRQRLFPHFSKVIIEDHVVIGTGTIIHRGVMTPTVIGQGTAISANCFIGHNSVIGCNVYISPGVKLGGSVKIGDRCFLGMECCIRDTVKIADETTIGMNATVTRSCFEPGSTIMGKPAKPIGKMFGASRV